MRFSQVPILMKATADDETPCPGYIFEEIGSILLQSVNYVFICLVTVMISHFLVFNNDCGYFD